MFVRTHPQQWSLSPVRKGVPPYVFSYNINGGPAKTISSVSGNSVTLPVSADVAGVFKYNLLGVTDASENACSSVQSGSVDVTVNPLPGVVALADKEYCNGVRTEEIVFTNPVIGTTYSWTNSNPSIGLAANGTGKIPAFTARNNGTSSVVATIRVTPRSNGCNGVDQEFFITVYPSAAVTFSIESQTICSGDKSEEVILNSQTPNARFSWSAVQPAGITGVITSGENMIPPQNLVNTTNSPIQIIYKATASVSGVSACSGAEYLYLVTVNPAPDIREEFLQDICSNTPFRIAPVNGGENLVPTGTLYIWDNPVLSPPGSITGASNQEIPQSTVSQVLSNSTLQPAVTTYSITPSFKGCMGQPFDALIKVFPLPAVNSVNNIVLCNGEQSTEIVFSGGPPGTGYKWTSNNANVGMPGSGTGIIPSFKAINSGSSPVVITITVVPQLVQGPLTCEGPPMKFTITVNPSAQVNNPGSQVICNNVLTNIKFTTANQGGTTTYAWVNNNPEIGLSGSGNGDIEFMPVNSKSSPVSATITVIPTYINLIGECPGDPVTFTITVNPEIFMQPVTNQEVCNGVYTQEVQFTGNSPEITYSWKLNNPSIGMPVTGLGNIPSFIARNQTESPVLATFTVTPLLNGCSGESRDFTITVNPSAILTTNPKSGIICLGEMPAPLSVGFSNGIGTPAYQWYSNTINSGLGGTLISGETNPVFNPPHNLAGTMYYYCIITFPSGVCNTLISDIAKVEINQVPVISDKIVEISSGETFMVIPESNSIDIVPVGTAYTWLLHEIIPVSSVTGAASHRSHKN
jgi:large repetitive protein